MARAACPKCGRGVAVYGKVKVGRRTHCQGCATEVVVVGVEPLRLNRVKKEEGEGGR